MAYKIAIASTDGKVVNQHFGKAEKFYIINVDEDVSSYEVIDIRETQAACQAGGHSDNGMDTVVQLLSDVDYVLVSQIGTGAEHALKNAGITAFAISHYIDEAVKKIIEYNQRLKKNRN
jgi:nitrogen fixation protein NifX